MEMHKKGAGSSFSRRNSQGIKLRTISKDRSNHKSVILQKLNRQNSNNYLQFATMDTSNDQEMNNLQGIRNTQTNPRFKLENPFPIKIQNKGQGSRINNPRNTLDNQLILRPSEKKIESFMRKLALLDQKAENLIQRRLNKILKDHEQEAKNHRVLSLKNTGQNQFEEEFQKLISQVSSLRVDKLEKQNYDTKQLQLLMDKKINLLEKILAEKSIEAEILKKHYFSRSTHGQTKNPKNKRLNKMLLNMTKPKLLPLPINQKRSSTLCEQSLARVSYRAPKLQQYETYRHRAPPAIINPQPLPQSSYKNQYLIHRAGNQNIPCKNYDTYAFFGKNRKTNSTYSKDYKNLPTQQLDYREFDSYRNKIKNLQVSYIFNRNNSYDNSLTQNQNQEQMQQNILLDHGSSHKAASNIRYKTLDTESSKDKMILPKNTESHSQYRGISGGISKIKNKELDHLKFLYKSVVHS